MVNQKIALVIDDELDVVNAVKELLKEELHYLVLTATDPEVAVDLAQNYLFDLLILDLHMPKLDGFQVLDIVRKKQPEIKVIVITGLYERYKERFKQTKVDKIVEKPFEPLQFQKDILEIAGAVTQIPVDRKALVPEAKILLVDDEKEQSQYLREFLLEDKPNGYQIELAENGEEGIQKTAEFEPDILIFDLKMPHMLGSEMMERIKSQDGHKPKLFIAVSAIALPETIQQMEHSGCLYVTKPFRVDEMISLIRNKCLELKLVKHANG